MDSMLGLFRKNAVAGRLSVAFQQPLAYARAMYAINPKYLAKAFAGGGQLVRGERNMMNEMLKYSGVAVIKNMGRMDMGMGLSATEYLHDGKKNLGEKISDAMTILPNTMDNVTWTRMWRAVKLEQMELHRGEDYQSEAFLKRCGERFNDIMRLTQVYDSVMSRSQMMRSKATPMKMITSFMAEPTLTANMLVDSVVNSKGKKERFMKMSTALTAFVINAAAGAIIKGFFSATRNDDDDKTLREQLQSAAIRNLISELNPLGLLPMYSQIVTALTEGTVADDRYAVIDNLVKAINKIASLPDMLKDGMLTAKDAYRFVEDTSGVLVQLTTNAPLKNVMQDTRALVNAAFNMMGMESPLGGNNVSRDTSGAVLKYGSMMTLRQSSAVAGILDNVLGTELTSKKWYNADLYKAYVKGLKTGNMDEYDQLREYGVLSGDITKAKSSGDKTQEEKRNASLDNIMKAAIKDALSRGDINYDTAVEYAEAFYKDRPTAMKSLMEVIGQESSEVYRDMYDALDAGNAEGVTKAMDALRENGFTENTILSNARKYMTDKVRSGEMDALTASRAAAVAGLYKDQQSAYAAYTQTTMDETPNQILKGDISSYTNDTRGIEETVSGMMAAGYTLKQVQTAVSGLKQEYLGLTGTKKTNMRSGMITALVAAGMKLKDAQAYVDKWK